MGNCGKIGTPRDQQNNCVSTPEIDSIPQDDKARSDVDVGCTEIGMGERMGWASSCGYEGEGGLAAE